MLVRKKEDEEKFLNLYDSKMICSDWRYSASVVGLILYFEHHKIKFHFEDDYILYNHEDITLEKYLAFVEYHFNYYSDSKGMPRYYMHHLHLEKLLLKDDLNENEEKEFNEILQRNSTVKKIFPKMKYSQDNKESFKSIIEENRQALIEGTYINGHSLYAKFCNSNMFFKNTLHCCRLLGYYFDGGRKSKNIGFAFDKSTFVYEDCLEFDFIPFAFTKTDESMFINNNYSVKELMATYRNLNFSEKPRRSIFENVENATSFVDHDVEVILKDGKDKNFETFYIRQKAIEIFRNIKNYEYFANKVVKLNSKEYLNLEQEVTKSVINLNRLDNLILLLLKKNYSKSVIYTLININVSIYNGGIKMEKGSYKAKYAAGEILSKLPENKINSYKNKLLSCLATNDYETFNVTLLKLSSFAGVEMPFAYDLFDDFENNKNIAFSFVNSLTIKKEK